MKLLLDTHIWLWGLLEPKRLSKRVARELGNPDNELWLSSISVWELLVLAEKGRVELTEPAGAWAEKALAKAALIEAPVTHEVALETCKVEPKLRDPADRFLVATARVFGLTLVTADASVIRSEACRVLANR